MSSNDKTHRDLLSDEVTSSPHQFLLKDLTNIIVDYSYDTRALLKELLSGYIEHPIDDITFIDIDKHLNDSIQEFNYILSKFESFDKGELYRYFTCTTLDNISSEVDYCTVIKGRRQSRRAPLALKVDLIFKLFKYGVVTDICCNPIEISYLMRVYVLGPTYDDGCTSYLPHKTTIFCELCNKRRGFKPSDIQ